MLGLALALPPVWDFLTVLHGIVTRPRNGTNHPLVIPFDVSKLVIADLLKDFLSVARPLSKRGIVGISSSTPQVCRAT
jgi:hypothetical protein